MRIVGLQKTTLIDYPGLVAATIFTYGCSFRCGFCHNPDLVTGNIGGLQVTKAQEVLDFLQKRKGILEGVVVTGGEPLINKDMPEFLRQIKALGYKIKLDTNGSNPEMLAKIITEGLVDYLAMDIKNSLGKYSLATGTDVDTGKIRESVRLIMESGLAYEFRTTVLPEIHEVSDFEDIGSLIKGAPRYAIQGFRPTVTLDPSFRNLPSFTFAELEKIREVMSRYVGTCEIRDNL